MRKCISITSHSFSSPITPTSLLLIVHPNQDPTLHEPNHQTHPSIMAPYSPAIGSSLSQESQAPPAPKLSTKLLSSLLSPQTQVLPLAKDGSIPSMKPRKLDYSPHTSNTHGRAEPPRKRSWPGISTVMWSVLLVMIIGVSSSTYQYEAVGREQSMMDVVKDAYFGQGVKLNERDMGSTIYLVKEPSSDMEIEVEMRKRDDTPTSSIAPPVDSPSAVLMASSTTSSSSVRPTPTGAKANFRNPDDVRDPTAVKPSDDMESQPPPDDTQPTDMPNKRHWGSRSRAVNSGKRSP